MRRGPVQAAFPIAAVLAFLPSPCQSATVPPRGAEIVTGRWGGEQIGVVLTEQGGTVEHSCAAGAIEEPLRPGADGRFAARGTHTPGTGGPARVGQRPERLPAHYSGRVEGSAMTLRIEIPERDLVIGPVTLQRGAEPMLVRCL